MHLRPRLLPFMRTSARSAVEDRAGVLLVQWGRHNAGPMILREYACAFQPALGSRLHVSGNRAVEAAVRPPRGVAHFDVDTYDGALGAVFGVPRLFVQAVRLRRYIRLHRIGTVFAPMFSLWQTLALVLWLPADVRYVTAIHDADDHPGEHHVLRDLCRWIELHRAQVVVVFSAAVHAVVHQKAVAGDILRLQLGAPAASRPRTGVHAVPVIGFFGRIVDYKGLDLFVDTVVRLDLDGPVRGVVHGAGKVDADVLHRAPALVDWHIGYLGEEQILDVLEAIDVLVLPYREASQSGVVLQAFAAGLPVVATPVGALPEQVEGRGGVLAVGLDAEAVAAAVRDVIADPIRYADLSANAIRTAQASTWPAVSLPLLRLLMEDHA